MNKMKRIIIILFLSISLFSCSLDNGEGAYLEIVPVSTVEMPTAFRVDSITTIPVNYFLPSACHEFSNFYYNSIGNERTVAIYCIKYDGQNCTPNSNYETTVPLRFKPKEIGTYNFRFWTGVNENGVDQYIIHEVVVDH